MLAQVERLRNDVAVFKVLSSKFRVLSSAAAGAFRTWMRALAWPKPLRGLNSELGTWNSELKILAAFTPGKDETTGAEPFRSAVKILVRCPVVWDRS